MVSSMSFPERRSRFVELEEPPIERIVAEIYRRGLPPGDG